MPKDVQPDGRALVEAKELGAIFGAYLLSLCDERMPKGLSIERWSVQAPSYMISRGLQNSRWAYQRLSNIAFSTVIDLGRFEMSISQLVRPPDAHMVWLIAYGMGQRSMSVCGECSAPIVFRDDGELACLHCENFSRDLLPKPWREWHVVLMGACGALEAEQLMARALPPGAEVPR